MHFKLKWNFARVDNLLEAYNLRQSSNLWCPITRIHQSNETWRDML